MSWSSCPVSPAPKGWWGRKPKCAGKKYNPKYWGCCDHEALYHKAHYICCGRTVYPKNTPCCGSRTYNHSTHMCCSGNAGLTVGRAAVEPTTTTHLRTSAAGTRTLNMSPVSHWSMSKLKVFSHCGTRGRFLFDVGVKI